MATTEENLLGLAFSARELRKITDWPFPLIEDYLSIRSNVITISRTVDEKEDKLKNIVVVGSSPYEPDGEDVVIVCDTTLIDISVNLPAGIVGTNYRIINFGGTDKKVYVTPNGSELLYGVNETEYIVNQESLIMTYQDVVGWN